MRTSIPNFSNLIKTPLAIIALFLSISLAFVCIPSDITDRVKMTCVAPLRPVQWLICFCGNSVNTFFDNFISSWKDTETKRQLEMEVARYRNKVLEQQDIIYKLQDKLQSISRYQANGKSNGTNIVPADIIGYDTSNFRKSITINVGLKHGIDKNDVVISNNALVGKISTVSARTSVVQLITDPASTVPGRVLQTREQVLVEGNGSAFCQLKYVPRHAKLKEGDEILSSDIGNFYPSSLPVATITENTIRGGSLFRSVKALPVVNISEIESVLVLIDW